MLNQHAFLNGDKIRKKLYVTQNRAAFLQRRISHVRQTLSVKEWGEPAESGAISELDQVSVAVLV